MIYHNPSILIVLVLKKSNTQTQGTENILWKLETFEIFGNMQILV